LQTSTIDDESDKVIALLGLNFETGFESFFENEDDTELLEFPLFVE